MTTKQPATLLIHPERAVPGGFRSLVPGTERASTVLFENIDKWKNRSGFDESIYTYGTSGTPTTRDLQNRLAEWAGGFATVLFPSGLGLKLDDKDVGRAGFVRCLPNGCVAEVVMEDTLLNQLKTAKTATFIIFETPEEGIGFPLSLKGLGEGYDKLP